MPHRVLFTLGREDLYDAWIAEGPIWKGGRDYRGVGGTVWQDLEMCARRAEINPAFAIYLVEWPRWVPVVWDAKKEKGGELLFDCFIIAKLDLK